MGQALALRRMALYTASSLFLTLSLSGCNKLGMGEPRVMPDNAPVLLGPKRAPDGQHSSQNTPEALRAMASGAVSPGPSDMAALPRPIMPQEQPQQQPQPVMQETAMVDAYDPYSASNFWSSSTGWSSNPAVLNNTRAAAPTIQPPPVVQPMMQMQAPSSPPSLPPMQLLRQQAVQQPQVQPMPVPAQRYAARPALMPVQSPYPSAMMAPTPQAEFPQLQEVPQPPYYRSNVEIASDLNELQSESQAASMYQQLSPSYGQSYEQSYQGYDQGYPHPAPAPQLPQLRDQGMAQPVALSNPNFYTSAPASPYGMPVEAAWNNPSAYSASAFVPPAPIAAVPDAPVLAQDWDSRAYAGGNPGRGVSAPVELRMPYALNGQHFLPDSRYGSLRRQGYR